MVTISHFVFTISIGDKLRTVQIRGNGGNLGDGCAYITDPAVACRAGDKLLRLAQRNLDKTGELHVGFPIPEVLVPTADQPIHILDCRPIFR